MKKMTPRERVLAAARRKPVDRTPVMLWIEPHTLVKIANEVEPPRKAGDRLLNNAVAALQGAAKREDVRNALAFLTYLTSPDYLIQLGTDVVEFPWMGPLTSARRFEVRDGKLVITDVYGSELSMMGLYLETVGYPIKSVEQLDSYRFPKMDDPLLRAGIRSFRKSHPDIAAYVSIPGVQDVSQKFMGMENLYTWMAMYPEKIKSFFGRMLDHTLDLIKAYMGAGADFVTVLDDYGAQDRMLISKRMWEEFTFPCLRRQCEEVHGRGGLVMLHSCGHVQPLLDKLVEAGVDMLQSFQPAAGNDLEKAKREFGDRLCFVTGIDSQTLSSMDTDRIRETILNNHRIGSEGGGFILATNHALQVDTPGEKLKAALDTVREIKNGFAG